MGTVRNVYTNIRSLQSAIKDAGRLRQIATVLARHGFGALVARLGLREVAPEDAALPPPDGSERPEPTEPVDADTLVAELTDAGRAGDAEAARLGLPERIRLVFEELGPTFIKLGQILSTRPDLLPADILAELQNLQDNVPPMTRDEVAAQILEQLGDEPEHLFATFDWQPLACASIAQVHVATLNPVAATPRNDAEEATRSRNEQSATGGDGAGPSTAMDDHSEALPQDSNPPEVSPDGASGAPEVVVKIQRPGIAATIQSDLHILHFLASRAAAMLPELELLDPVGIVGEFERAILREIDFTHELQHILRFRRNFEGYEGVRIPQVHAELCTESILVMERVRGVKVTRAPAELGIDPYEVAPRMLHALFKMMFRDGFFHGDMHPGNILIDEDGTIGLIDFGLIGRLSPQQRDNVMDILVGISREDYPLVARIYFELGIKEPGTGYDYERFEGDVIEIMEQHISGRTLNDIDIGSFFAALVEGCMRHRIRMPPTYTMVFKALVTVEGIGRTLAPRVNFIEEAQPFVKEVLLERYDPRRLMQEGVQTLDALTRFLRFAPWNAQQVLRDLAHGRLVLSTELHNADVLGEAAENASVLQGRAIVGGALIVAGAVALPHGAPLFWGVTPLSLTLFALGALAARPVFVRWRKSR